MTLRLRLLLLMLAIYGIGGYFITRWIMGQVRPRYLESMEETLVDTSVLLAGVVEAHSASSLDATVIRKAYQAAAEHAFAARIFSLEKHGIDLRVYVTDVHGRVIFDSQQRDEGKDFSRYNDVWRTLRGHYGARSSRTVPGDDQTQVIYVAAPVHRAGRIAGVLTVGKPTRGINELVQVAKHRIVVGAVTGGAILLLVLVLAASWVIAPIERLTAYARAIRDGRAVTRPNLPGRTLHDLGTAFEEMRDALEGRQHAERYTRALAHEVKSPLAGIRGAAELLDEEMPAEQQAKFLANIRSEAARIQAIVDRLLELTAIESRKSLQQIEPLETDTLAREAVEAVHGAAAAARVRISLAADSATVKGDRYLLRQALVNLLQNAIEFSPAGGEVVLACQVDSDRVQFSVSDRGAGVPGYALPRVFERFYSLPRPGGTRKSTGIGLPLVREIAHLHNGEATLANRPDGGAVAMLTLPIA